MTRSLFIGGLLAVLAAGAPAAAGTRGSMQAETQELSAQSAQASRPRVTIHRRKTTLSPNAKRQCRSWLVQEYRVSGTVIVPRMQCWWE